MRLAGIGPNRNGVCPRFLPLPRELRPKLQSFVCAWPAGGRAEVWQGIEFGIVKCGHLLAAIFVRFNLILTVDESQSAMEWVTRSFSLAMT